MPSRPSLWLVVICCSCRTIALHYTPTSFGGRATSRAVCIAGPSYGGDGEGGGDLGEAPREDCLMFGRMLQAKGVAVEYKLAQQDARRTEAQVCSVLRSAFHRPAPDGVNIIYFSGHGVAAWSECPPLGSAPARLLRLLRTRLAALGSSALPGRGRPTGRPATASGARAGRLQSRRLHRL